jgi:hypothetical protein
MRRLAVAALGTLLAGCNGTAEGGSGGGRSTGGGSAVGGGSATGGGTAAGGGTATGGGTAAGGGTASGGGTATGGGTASGGGTATGGGSGTGGAGGLFEKPHAWNKDVSGLPKSPRSDAITTALSGLGGWGNGNKLQIDFSIALLFADSTTPRRTITGPAGSTYCYAQPTIDCDPVPLQMPLPANGNTEGSADYTCDPSQNDCHVLVVERSEKKLYELYNATAAGAAFTALGAFTWDLTKQYTDVLRGDQCTSADAAGLPIAALLPTSDEVATGTVRHALRFILPNARMKKQVYVRPATHAGGPSSTNADAPPYGVRLRLKPGFDETPYSAGARAILKALKTYGMILSDGGNIALTFADDRLSTAKWATLGITAQTFNSIGVANFEVVDLGAEIPLTFDCVRAP